MFDEEEFEGFYTFMVSFIWTEQILIPLKSISFQEYSEVVVVT